MQTINLYERPLLIEIPLDLIFLPYYQENRKAANRPGAESIKANFKKNRFEPIRVNYRKDGKFKNYFFVNDGEHRITVANELGKKSIWALTYSESTDEEALLFANQHENTKNLEQINKFLACLSVSGKSEDKYVQQARMLNKALVKYHIDPTIKGLCHGTLRSSVFVNKSGCVKDLEDRYDWMFHILTKSGFYTTQQGLGSTIVIALNKIWTACKDKNMFKGLITPKGVVPILVDAIKDQTTGSLINSGKALFDKDITLSTTKVDKRRLVQEYFIYCICDRLSIEWHPDTKVQ